MRIRIIGFIRRRLLFYLALCIVSAITLYIFETMKELHLFTFQRLSIKMEEYICEGNYSFGYTSDYSTFDMFKEIVANHKLQQFEESEVPKRQIELLLLPISHVDPGWLKTFDEYTVQTDSILDNMVLFLESHPKMRFMWCEIVFLEHWWNKINVTTKALVRKFVESGQLEITSGSWVMTDEANPYFASTVDNIIEGQQFVHSALGTVPEVMWSNDPFGYGSAVPYLFSKAGIQNVVINRIHHSLKLHLQRNHAIPFRWRQPFDKTGKSDVQTHILPYGHYDILNSCGPDELACCQFDFKRMTHFGCSGRFVQPIDEANLRKKSLLLEQAFLQMATLYQDNVMITVWGDDFRFTDLQEWYQQYDNLMPLFEDINKRGQINVRFGTFKDYFTALKRNKKSQNTTLPTLTGDFFPYMCTTSSYWTGYYTTRPFFKRRERELHALIRAADILTAFAMNSYSKEEKDFAVITLQAARRNLALFQHHDAITGTSRGHVMADYLKRMSASMLDVANVLTLSASVLLKNEIQTLDDLPTLYNETASKKRIAVDSTKWIAVYNSLPNAKTEVITLRVASSDIEVSSDQGKITAQIDPYFDPISGLFTDDFLLAFSATLEPLSLTIFKLRKAAVDTTQKSKIFAFGEVSKHGVTYETLKQNFEITNVYGSKSKISFGSIEAVFSEKNGLLSSVRMRDGNMALVQGFEKFTGGWGGAYVLQMSSASTRPLDDDERMRFVAMGPIKQTMYSISRSIQQEVSVYNIEGSDGERLHVKLRVDVPREQMDVVARFQTNWPIYEAQFYTDSLGLHLNRRNRYANLSVEANYYPMPTTFVVENSKLRLSILSNVPHGARAYNLYSYFGIEIMLDRWITMDDAKGLAGADDSIPDDNIPVNMEFTIVLETLSEAPEMSSHFAYNTLKAHNALQSLLYKPTVFFSNVSLSSSWITQYFPFPCDVQLLTVRPISTAKSLLVLHRNGIDCNTDEISLCPVVKIDDAVKNLLSSIGATSVQKTTLSGVRTLEERTSLLNATFNMEPMDFFSYIVRFN